MGRKRVNLEYIADATSRRNTFRKRHRGILKKVRELSVLCDVKACAVIYGEDDTTAAAWPDKDETEKTLQSFKDLPEFDQTRKMLNQEGFTKQCLVKRRDQVLRNRRENEDLKMTFIVAEELSGRIFYDLSVDQTYTLADFVKRKANEVNLHIEIMKRRLMAAVTAESVRGKAPMDRQNDAMAPQTKWHVEIMPKSNGPAFFDGAVNMEHLMQPYSGGGGGGRRFVGPFNPF